jgi:hypothetical protein
MRSLQERAMLLLETIVGKEELATMLLNEDGAILQGGLYTKPSLYADMQKCIHFGFTDNSLIHRNRPSSVMPVLNTFQTPFATIENDESKHLRVYIDWKTRGHDKHNWYEDHNAIVDTNNAILMAVSKMFEEDSVFELKYDFEEIGGVATRYYKFGFRLRGGRVKYQFISANTTLADDPYFWQSLADFIGSRYTVYVPAELLKTDYANIIEGLPEQIAWDEFEARYADKQYGK